MIIVLHGFGSTGDGSSTCQLVKESFPEHKVLAPTYTSGEFEHTIDELVKQIKPELSGEDNITFVGISLGGFFARYLADKSIDLFGVPCWDLIMLNPALHAPKSVRKYMGMNKNYNTGEKFEVTEKSISNLQKYVLTKDRPGLGITVITADNDDSIDPTLAREMYADRARLVNFKEGGHRLQGKKEQIVEEIDFAINNVVI